MDLTIRKKKAGAMERSGWAGQAENLRAALELYCMELEKALGELSELLKAYSMDLSAGQAHGTGTGGLPQRPRETMEVR